ncbi:hypothetical protein [Sellimonas caecigallum]|uniref:DUF4956 domain-containing protein n=1 Tax=Sellimonas caecigallum TaxID=2592333 RepID=A0ABS7L8B0_9FIRM|nr:hypothetical protein [Sellimonas caecigallum]MBY0759339.1 hypothetical protein [Sellimonas caecigallum]
MYTNIIIKVIEYNSLTILAFNILAIVCNYLYGKAKHRKKGKKVRIISLFMGIAFFTIVCNSIGYELGRRQTINLILVFNLLCILAIILTAGIYIGAEKDAKYGVMRFFGTFMCGYMICRIIFYIMNRQSISVIISSLALIIFGLYRIYFMTEESLILRFRKYRKELHEEMEEFDKELEEKAQKRIETMPDYNESNKKAKDEIDCGFTYDGEFVFVTKAFVDVYMSPDGRYFKRGFGGKLYEVFK